MNTTPSSPPQSERMERELLVRVSAAVVRRGMTAPAILFLGSVAPLGFVASQAMLFLAPIVDAFFSRADYDTLQRILERRDGVERLLQEIERADAERDGKKDAGVRQPGGGDPQPGGGDEDGGAVGKPGQEPGGDPSGGAK